MTSLALFALLLSLVSVPPGYENDARLIPSNHWQYVERITVDDSTLPQTFPWREIVLPTWDGTQHGLFVHEMGHVMLEACPNEFDDWKARFWDMYPNEPHFGTPKGKPVSRRASDNPYEDFAETYSSVLRYATLPDPERESWMKNFVLRVC